MPFLTILVLFSVICLISPCDAQRFKRCFVCRSRGPLGSCRDTFPLNATTPANTVSEKIPGTGITLDPCASGWCGKVIEGKDEDHLQATERFCLTRPPDDSSETCAVSALQNRKNVQTYLCLCRGDLCNGASSLRTQISHAIPLMLSYLAFASFFALMRYI